MEGKKGVFSVLLFLLATVSIVGLAGAMAAREKALSDAAASAVEGKRLFYAARDIESSFWKGVKIGVSNCAKNWDSEGCVKSNYLAEWKNYAESYWLEDVKFSVFAGTFSGGGTVSKSEAQWDAPLVITKIPVKAGGMTVYLLRAAITTSAGYNGIFVGMDGGDANTYALLKSGEGYSCVYAPVAGALLESGGEYSSLPLC